jgi:hypothetical protein
MMHNPRNLLQSLYQAAGIRACQQLTLNFIIVVSIGAIPLTPEMVRLWFYEGS